MPPESINQPSSRFSPSGLGQQSAPEESDIPAVVAVVVANNPGSYFEETLNSLSVQTYKNLSVLVVDAGSEEPLADRVASVLPDAYLHRIAGHPGWSVAANQSMELVSGSPFLLFCHDDVVLDPTCVALLMAELYKSNAAIVGPKLVDWEDGRRLLQIGMGTDRFGVPVDQVDRGEFDQEQYDSSRDVFYVPGGVQLVRSDLLEAIGGFDEAITFFGEDLDLCWRAHSVGAKVRIVPKAKAKHRESSQDKIPASRARKLATRHRLRTVLSAVTAKSFFTVIIPAFILIFLEGIYSLFVGRRQQAKDVLSAIPWNLSQLGSIRKRRKKIAAIRNLSDKEIRSKQVRGSARFTKLRRKKFEQRRDRLESSNFIGSVGGLLKDRSEKESGPSNDTSTDPLSSLHAMVLFGVTAVVLFIGVFSILRGNFAVLGQIPYVSDGRFLFREWMGGWRSAGTGGAGNAPSAYFLLSVGKAFFFWAPSIFQKLLILAPLWIGVWGATRLATPFGSPRMRAISGMLYAFNPILFWIMRAGRWESLIIWAAAPFLLTSLFKVAGIKPFDLDTASSDSKSRLSGISDYRYVPRPFAVKLLRYGILVAFVAAFAPSVVVISIIMSLSLACISIPHLESFKALLFSTLAAILVPAVLHIPWSYDILRSFSWSWVVGTKSSEATDLGLIDILRFRTAEVADNSGAGFESLTEQPLAAQIMPISGWVVTILALGAVFLVKNNRRIVLSSWCIALGLWFVLWLESTKALPFSLPAAESMLAPVVAGLLVAIACVAVQYEKIFFKTVSRWKYVLLTFGVASIALSFTGGVLAAGTGKWGMPSESYNDRFAFLDFSAKSTFPEVSASESSGRVLWLGDPSAVPVDTSETDDGISYAVTDNGIVTPVANTSDFLKSVSEDIDLAFSNKTPNFGRLLALYGIDFVAVPEQSSSSTEAMKVMLQQVDLAESDFEDQESVTIYENAAAKSSGRILWLGDPSVIPVDTLKTDGGISYAVTANTIDVRNRWLSGAVGSMGGVGKQIDLAFSNKTPTLGRLLALYGIDFVVIPEQLAPGYKINPASAEIMNMITQQVDLKKRGLAGGKNITVYENAASYGLGASLPDTNQEGALTASSQLGLDLSNSSVSVFSNSDIPGHWRVRKSDQKNIFLSIPADGLKIADSEETVEKGFDHMSVLAGGQEEVISLKYPASNGRRLALILQFLLITSGVIIAQTRKGVEV